MPHTARQTGATLIELLVGMAIGLMTAATALGTLAMAWSVSGTASEAAALQQQAALALRIIGTQVRQAGALTPVAAGTVAGVPMSGFEARTLPIVSAGNGTGAVLAGKATDRLTVASQTAEAPLVTTDCLGNRVTSREYSSSFAVDANGHLSCLSSAGGGAQPLIEQVADFQVRYRLHQQDGTGTAGFTIRDEPDGEVVAIEICLELIGRQTSPDAARRYADCQHSSPVAPRDGRMRLVFRQVFQLRSLVSPHSSAMRQETGKKWAAAAVSEPAIFLPPTLL